MRFRALIAVALLGAFSAWADWVYLSVPGTPNDLQMLDAGLFVVASSTQAQVVSCPQGGACSIVMSPAALAPVTGTNIRTAALTPSACLFGITNAGTQVGCLTTSIGSSFTTVEVARCTTDGLCGVTGSISGLAHYAITDSPFGSWTVTNGVGGTFVTSALGVARIDGVDYGFVPFSTGTALVLDAGTATAIPGLTSGAASITTFASARGGLGLFVTQNAAPFERYGDDFTFAGTPDAGWSPKTFTIDPAVGDLGQAAYTESLGSPLSFGFGMGAQRDSGFVVAGSIPNPNQLGLNWVARTIQPDAGAAFHTVSCSDARFCAAVLALASPELNVIAYWNSAAPTVGAFPIQPSGSIVGEGVSTPVIAVVADPDGDPVYVTWEDDGGLVQVLGNPDGGADGKSATLIGRPADGGACTSSWTISGIASDGLIGHDTRFSESVTHLRGSADAPTVSPSMVAPIAAGSTSTIVFSAHADGGCAPGMYTWQLHAPDAGTLNVQGAQATYVPPTYFCATSGSDVVSVNDFFVTASPTVSVNVPIVPWGAPNTPLFTAGTVATQVAGTTVFYGLAPIGNHVCEATAGFPGLTLLVDGGASGNGLNVVSTDSCTSQTLVFGVQTEVSGEDAGRLSPASTFTVNIVGNATPLVPPVPFSMHFEFDGGTEISGTFDATANCLAERGLTATVQVFAPDGGVVASTAGLVPSSWDLPIPDICAGGSFSVVALLFQDGGIIGSDDAGFSHGVGSVHVGDLSASTLPVSCAGLDAPITVNSIITDGGCALSGAASVVWTQTSGVSLDQTTLDGVTVQARSSRPLAELIGESVSWLIDADNGAGQHDPETRTVTLVDRFVTLEHTLTPANADALLTVQVHVTSTETCDVQDVVLREQPAGLTVVEGTAFVDRDALGSSRDGGELDLGPFSLAAGQTRVVTYTARLPLLATPVPVGEAWVKQTSVTIVQVPQAPPDACGCGSSPGAALLIAASLLLRARRRRGGD